MAINKVGIPAYGPFKLWTIQNFPFIEEDFDAITNYQLYSKIVEFCKKVAENQNILDFKYNELIDAFNELENYVNNYFENLDVQEEINNKLDEMAESGQLSDIIAQYLDLAGVLTFDTIADMSDAENIANGSTCYTLGQNIYNDGKGGFYKVRTITSGDTVDGFNIVALDISETLIAERIPNYYINELNSQLAGINENIENLENEIDNKYNRTDNLMLQNFILYDIPSTEYSQGSTTDGEKLYIYKTADSETGDILIFNNETLESTISNVPFEHGNSICYKNNKIYSTLSSNDKTIKVLDLSNTTYSEIEPFSDDAFNSYQDVIGITNYDNNHLLCLLGYKDSEPYINDINKCVLVKVNVNNLNYEIIELENSNYYNIDNLAIQNVSYYNNHVYLLCSQSNMILDFIPNENKFNLNKIYNIPFKDLLGLTIGEVEQVTPFINNTFILTTHILENYGSDYRTIKTYFLSFETELASLYKKITVDDISAYRTPIYCNSNATTLYENGSSAYPFKSIVRALEYVNYNKLTDSDQIVISSGNYKLNTLYNLKKGTINEGSVSGTINFTGDTKLVNCNLNFNTDALTMTFGKIDISDGNNNFNGKISCSDTIELSNTKTNINGLISTLNVADVLPVRVRKGSICNIIVTSKVTSYQTFFITTGGVCFSNDSTKVISGTGTLIVTGTHSAD